MECRKCRVEISDSARFCPECGCRQADIEGLRQRCSADGKECERAVSEGEGSRSYVRRNYDKRLSEWMEAAEAGVAEAQWLLARCYDEGFGVERNSIHAVGWHVKAAEQGYPAAQNHLGSCYQNGDGVPQDDEEAVRWYRKAAEQGHAIAQANLGWCCDTGSGVAQDEAEAVRWYREAAEQGECTSQFNLGVHYECGSGLEQDEQEAMEWYSRSAEQGYEQAGEALERLSREVEAEQKQRRAKAEEGERRFRRACREVLAEGTAALDESTRLRVLGDSFGMSEEVGKRLFAQEKGVFLRERAAQADRDAEVKFRIACKNSISDGKVTIEEKDELRRLGKSLKLSKDIMRRHFEEEKKVFKASQQVKPTRSVEARFRKACKKVLADGKVTPDEESQLKGLGRYFNISTEAMKEILADEVRIWRQMRKDRPTKGAVLQFSKLCKEVLADGKVTPDEEKQLRSLAKFLNIPDETMKRIFGHEARVYQRTHSAKQAD